MGKVLYFLLIKSNQLGYFNEARGNPKQTIILFWLKITQIITVTVPIDGWSQRRHGGCCQVPAESWGIRASWSQDPKRLGEGHCKYKKVKVTNRLDQCKYQYTFKYILGHGDCKAKRRLQRAWWFI